MERLGQVFAIPQPYTSQQETKDAPLAAIIESLISPGQDPVARMN
jgi:hypothetical protein